MKTRKPTDFFKANIKRPYQTASFECFELQKKWREIVVADPRRFGDVPRELVTSSMMDIAEKNFPHMFGANRLKLALEFEPKNIRDLVGNATETLVYGYHGCFYTNVALGLKQIGYSAFLYDQYPYEKISYPTLGFRQLCVTLPTTKF
jgi:hypothetical protein